MSLLLYANFYLYLYTSIIYTSLEAGEILCDYYFLLPLCKLSLCIFLCCILLFLFVISLCFRLPFDVFIWVLQEIRQLFRQLFKNSFNFFWFRRWNNSHGIKSMQSKELMVESLWDSSLCSWLFSTFLCFLLL